MSKLEERFYGYKHWTLEKQPRCFYVGKGLKGRSKQLRNRNHKWHHIMKYFGGYTIEICVGPVTNAEVSVWEVKEILKENTFRQGSEHYRHNTSDIGCNFTSGGDGVIGRCHSEETKKKMSKSAQGRKMSNEARLNMRRAQSKIDIIQYDLSGKVIAVHKSQCEAQRITNVAQSNIYKCCRRKLKSAGKFVWRYSGDRFDPKLPAILTQEHRKKLSLTHMKQKNVVGEPK